MDVPHCWLQKNHKRIVTQGNQMRVCDRNKYWTLETLWCGALKKKGSTNLEYYNFTQNHLPPPQKIKNRDNDSGVADSGVTSIYLLPTAPNKNKRQPTINIAVGIAGGYILKNPHEYSILVNFIQK